MLRTVAAIVAAAFCKRPIEPFELRKPLQRNPHRAIHLSQLLSIDN